MEGQFLKVMFLTVAVAEYTMNTECPKYTPGEMPRIETLHSVVIQSGDSLILNCTCFNQANGQFTGPNKRPSLVTDKYLPYTHGTMLNPRLNKSKYMVFGGYDDNTCFLKISNFLSDDDGSYMCQYIKSSTIYIDVYNVVATSVKLPHETVLDKEWMLPLTVVIIPFIVISAVLLWRRKDRSERSSSRFEDIEQNTQDESVENRLYQSSQFIENHNLRGQNRVYRNEAVSFSQIHADEQCRGLNVTVTAKETGHGSREIVAQGAPAQINEVHMNYAEVTFGVQPSTSRFIIHGNDKRTIYSDIDHTMRAEHLPSSSSESEDD